MLAISRYKYKYKYKYKRYGTPAEIVCSSPQAREKATPCST
jgi:hypothetical protein